MDIEMDSLSRRYVSATARKLSKIENDAKTTDVVSGPLSSSDLLRLHVEGEVRQMGLKVEEGQSAMDSLCGYIRKCVKLHLRKLARETGQDNPGVLTLKVMAWGYRRRFPMESLHSKFDPQKVRQKRRRAPSPPPTEGGDSPPKRRRVAAATTITAARRQPKKRPAPTPGPAPPQKRRIVWLCVEHDASPPPASAPPTTTQPRTSSPPPDGPASPQERRIVWLSVEHDASPPASAPHTTTPPRTTASPPPDSDPEAGPSTSRDPYARVWASREDPPPDPLQQQCWLPDYNEEFQRFMHRNPRYTYSRDPPPPVYKYAAFYDSREVEDRPMSLADFHPPAGANMPWPFN